MPYNNESFPSISQKAIIKAFFHSFARKKNSFPHFERFLWSPKRKPKAIFLFSYTHLQKTRKWGVNIDKYTYYLRHWIAIVRNVGRCSCLLVDVNWIQVQFIDILYNAWPTQWTIFSFCKKFHLLNQSCHLQFAQQLFQTTFLSKLSITLYYISTNINVVGIAVCSCHATS